MSLEEMKNVLQLHASSDAKLSNTRNSVNKDVFSLHWKSSMKVSQPTLFESN